ncbi:MAG: LytR C-terminal domain-containing protein, partial [Leptolinea sp.]
IPPAKEIYGDDWPELLKQEGARVEISDASRVDGLGERTAAYLREKGVNITGVSLSPGSSTVSSIRSYTGMVYTTRFLADLFNIDSFRVENKYLQDSPMDIVLMIGKDRAKTGLVP